MIQNQSLWLAQESKWANQIVLFASGFRFFYELFVFFGFWIGKQKNEVSAEIWIWKKLYNLIKQKICIALLSQIILPLLSK